MPHCPHLLYTSVARSLDSTQRLSGWRWLVEATCALPAACTPEAGVLALTTGMSLTCNTQRLSPYLPRIDERMDWFQQGIAIAFHSQGNFGSNDSHCIGHSAIRLLKLTAIQDFPDSPMSKRSPFGVSECSDYIWHLP